MAIGWMTALKLVPWGDVIENAPAVVNGAKKLFTKTRGDAAAEQVKPATAVAPAAAGATDAERLAQLQAVLEQAQARMNTLETEARDTAALLKSMAEQQTTMIEAISILGRRSNVLVGVTVGLTVVCAALVFTLVLR